MADTNNSTVAANQETQIPEWEHIANSKDSGATIVRPRGATRRGFSTKLDRVLPPYKRYIGMRRKLFLLVLFAALLALLVLIIGLALGLSHRSKSVSSHTIQGMQLTSPQKQQEPSPSLQHQDIHWRFYILRHRPRRLR
jgi:hypothetical protein